VSATHVENLSINYLDEGSIPSGSTKIKNMEVIKLRLYPLDKILEKLKIESKYAKNNKNEYLSVIYEEIIELLKDDNFCKRLLGLYKVENNIYVDESKIKRLEQFKKLYFKLNLHFKDLKDEDGEYYKIKVGSNNDLLIYDRTKGNDTYLMIENNNIVIEYGKCKFVLKEKYIKNNNVDIKHKNNKDIENEVKEIKLVLLNDIIDKLNDERIKEKQNGNEYNVCKYKDIIELIKNKKFCERLLGLYEINNKIYVHENRLKRLEQFKELYIKLNLYKTSFSDGYYDIWKDQDDNLIINICILGIDGYFKYENSNVVLYYGGYKFIEINDNNIN